MRLASLGLWWIIHLSIIAAIVHLSRCLYGPRGEGITGPLALCTMHTFRTAPGEAKALTICFLMTIIAYHYCRLSDPGRLNGSKYDQAQGSDRLYTIDEVFSSEEDSTSSLCLADVDPESRSQVCGACGAAAQPTTKHCFLCDQCVMGWDHHCWWVGNCVGQANHRWFWLYLLVQVGGGEPGVFASAGVIQCSCFHSLLCTDRLLRPCI